MASPASCVNARRAYSGQMCETEVFGCEPNPCQNGEQLHREPEDFDECECKPGLPRYSPRVHRLHRRHGGPDAQLRAQRRPGRSFIAGAAATTANRTPPRSWSRPWMERCCTSVVCARTVRWPAGATATTARPIPPTEPFQCQRGWLRHELRVTHRRFARMLGQQRGRCARRADRQTDFIDVAAGHYFSCALHESGKVDLLGRQLLQPGVARSRGHVPEHRSGLLARLRRAHGRHARLLGARSSGNTPGGRFKSVSAGIEHTCAIRADDTAACWGNPDDGRTDAPDGTLRFGLRGRRTQLRPAHGSQHHLLGFERLRPGRAQAALILFCARARPGAGSASDLVVALRPWPRPSRRIASARSSAKVAEILEVVGRGGQGMVYRADDRWTKRDGRDQGLELEGGAQSLRWWSA